MPGAVLRAIHGLLHLGEAALYCTKQAVLLEDLEASEDLEKWNNLQKSVS